MMMNLTQHNLTSEQLNVGIIEPADKGYVKELLTFNTIPSEEDLIDRAKLLANYAISQKAESVLIGGAIYLMPYLINELDKFGIKAYYSFSKRESKDVMLSNGSVKKVVYFRHCGLIKATLPKKERK